MRAENVRSYATDGSAGPDRVGELLEALLENACDGELGLREAAQRQLEQAQRNADHVRRLRQHAAPAGMPDAGSPSLSQ